MIDAPTMRRAMIDRTERLASFYQLQRSAGFSPIEANEEMLAYAKRLDDLEEKMRDADR